MPQTVPKLGLVVPANNTTMTVELPSFLPAGADIVLRKVPRGKGLLTREDLPSYRAATLQVAASLADEDVDAVVYGCTAAGFLMGPDGDADISEALGRSTGRPVITSAASMCRVLEEEGACEIALVTPYGDVVNRQLVSYLDASGIAVRHLGAFGAITTEALAAIDSASVAGLARQTMTEDCDALFIACSQLPTKAILAPLRSETGRPVWSSISATAREVEKVLSAGPARPARRIDPEKVSRA